MKKKKKANFSSVFLLTIFEYDRHLSNYSLIHEFSKNDSSL